MPWSDVLSHKSDLVKLWDGTPIGWKTRELIGNAVDSVEFDPALKKVENLARILEKMPTAERETLEAEIGMKKASYYDKLKAGLDAEHAFIQQKNTLDDYMEVDPAPISVKEDPSFDDYVVVPDTEDIEMQKRVADAHSWLNSLHCDPIK